MRPLVLCIVTALLLAATAASDGKVELLYGEECEHGRRRPGENGTAVGTGYPMQAALVLVWSMVVDSTENLWGAGFVAGPATMIVGSTHIKNHWTTSLYDGFLLRVNGTSLVAI